MFNQSRNLLFRDFSESYTDSITGFEEKFGAHNYDRIDIVVAKASGCWLTDMKGRRYLDCLAAYSAASLGHHHPRIVDAITGCLGKDYGSVLSNVVYTDSLGLFLKKTAEFIPQLAPRFGEYGNKVLPKNGGVESVETAVKAARYYGWKCKGIPDGKQEIIVFKNNFHGRMTTVISFSSVKKYKQGFGPLTPGFVTVNFDDLDSVENAINENTCGILVEPMQGEGGMNIPTPGFLKGLRELSDKHDLLLLFDEIQVGLGRTGKRFAFEHEGVVPDGLILGKALSGGMIPLSVFVTNAELMDLVFRKGSDGSTYGGYPLACIAGIAALDVIEDEKLVERACLQGEKLKNQIMDLSEHSPYVKEVRGKGLFIGIEIKDGKAMEFCQKLCNYGALVNDSHGHTIRISPPLIINDEEIEYMTKALKKVLLS